MDKRNSFISINRDICNLVKAPSFFSSAGSNCFNLILEDNFIDGKGRVTIYVLGKVPLCLSCYDVPGGLLTRIKYISLETEEDSDSLDFYYDCPGIEAVDHDMFIDHSE